MRFQLFAMQEYQSCDAMSLMQPAPRALAKLVSRLQVPVCGALCTSREDDSQCWQSPDITDVHMLLKVTV